MSLTTRTTRAARRRGLLAPEDALTSAWPGELNLVQRDYEPSYPLKTVATFGISSEKLLILATDREIDVDLLFVWRFGVGEYPWQVQLSLIGADGWTLVRWNRTRRQPATEVLDAIRIATSTRYGSMVRTDPRRVSAIAARGAELQHEADVRYGRASPDDPGPDPTKRFGVWPGEVAAWLERPGAAELDD